MFHNTHKTPEQMTENGPKALLPNENLHVLLVLKVLQIYQISLTNSSSKFDKFMK